MGRLEGCLLVLTLELEAGAPRAQAEWRQVGEFTRAP